MEITIRRFSATPDSTAGLLYINGQFTCYTLEDQPQVHKIAGETCIPSGRYEIEFRNAGGMNERYKKKFDGHIGMLHLQNVPGFEWIYIHPGNTDDHTEGCILPGFGTRIQHDHTVQKSTDAYLKIYKEIKTAIKKRGEQVFISIGGI